MPAALRAAANSPSSDVVLSDRILKFHDHDRRAEIRDAYLAKLKALTPDRPEAERSAPFRRGIVPLRFRMAA